MKNESELKNLVRQWANSSEGRSQKIQLDLAHAPELMKILQHHHAPARLLELVLDHCRHDLRKDSGVFFTPGRSAEKIVRNALDIWQKNHPSYAELCNIKILDPACGVGEFLLAALDILVEKHRQFVPQQPIRKLWRKIINHNLYGIDINPDIMELLYLRLEIMAGKPLKRDHFVCTDALNAVSAGEFFGGKIKFDLAVGNPPYVSFGLRNSGRIERQRSMELRKRFANSAEYKISTYALFMEFAFNSIRRGGVNAFIVPDSFLCGQYFTKLRKFLLQKSSIEQISIVNNSLFRANPGRLVIYYLTRKRPDADHKLLSVLLQNSNELIPDRIYPMQQSEFKHNFRCRFRLFFDPLVHQRVRQIEQNAVCKLSDLVTLASGLVAKAGKKSIISQSPQPEGCWQRGITNGRSVLPNRQPLWQGEYINMDPAVIKSGISKVDYFQDKLLIRQTGDRIIAAVDKDNLLVLNNLHIAVAKKKFLDLDRLASYLNGDEMLFYYQAVTLEADRPMAQIDLETLRELPMKDFFRQNKTK